MSVCVKEDDLRVNSSHKNCLLTIYALKRVCLCNTNVLTPLKNTKMMEMLSPYLTPTAFMTVTLAFVIGTAIRIGLSDVDLSTAAAIRKLPSRGAFVNDVVFITGASGGIGEALALEFSRGGAIVILAARRETELARVAALCLAAGAASAEAVRLDVADTDTHELIIRGIISRHKRIDILCNNAGKSQRGLVARTTCAVDKELFQLNVFGAISITRHVLCAALSSKLPLRILNTSSVAGKVGSPGAATYAATKHALNGYMDSLRMEYSSKNISVTNACPGPVESDITLHALNETGGAHNLREPGARMTAARAAKAMVAALYCGLEETWLAKQPILAFLYVGQYFRSAYFSLGKRLGTTKVAAFEKGEHGYSSVSSAGAIFGGGANK